MKKSKHNPDENREQDSEKTEECFECQQQSYVQGPSTYYHNITLTNSSTPAKRLRLISNIDHL
jgi:hypothetical protein